MAQALRCHYDTTESAHQIIRAILNNRGTRTPLQVQREFIDEKREVGGRTKKLEGKIEELQRH